jgi:hypothetical protein
MNKIEQIVKEFGVKNIRFFIPMRRIERIAGIGFTSSTTSTEIVECVINEDQYKVADEYKITLQGPAGFGKEHFYLMDLNSILRDYPDDHTVYYITIDGYVKLDFTKEIV